jgi:CBS domain-containing protein
MKTAGEILKDKGNGMVCVDYDTPMFEALKIMNENKIGAILVKRENKIVGIWTERDLMSNCLNCLKDDLDPGKEVIGEHMNPNFITAKHSDNVYQLMDKFLGKHMRHLLVEKNGEYIGILSIGDVMRATMLEKDEELKRLNAIVSWEYYENWKWERTRIPPVIHNEEGLRVDI